MNPSSPFVSRLVLAAALTVPSFAHAREDRAIDRGIDPTAGLPRPVTPPRWPDDHLIRAGVRADAGRATLGLPEPGRTAIRPARARFVPSTGIAPVADRGPAGALRGERGIPQNQTLARGGGPLIAAVSSARVQTPVEAIHLADARMTEQTRESSMALPLGCSHLVAAGTPHVTRVSMQIVNADGRIIANDARRGRLAEISFCPRDRGSYRLTVQTRGSGGVVDSQVFVE
jgi:hypothetical protein